MMANIRPKSLELWMLLNHRQEKFPRNAFKRMRVGDFWLTKIWIKQKLIGIFYFSHVPWLTVATKTKPTFYIVLRFHSGELSVTIHNFLGTSWKNRVRRQDQLHNFTVNILMRGNLSESMILGIDLLSSAGFFSFRFYFALPSFIKLNLMCFSKSGIQVVAVFEDDVQKQSMV